VIRVLKDDLVKKIISEAGSQIENKPELWNDITGAMEAQGVDGAEIVRMTLEQLNQRQLLIPLLLAAWEHNEIDWHLIDTIAGNYANMILPDMLSKLKKKDLENILNYYGD